MTDITGTWAIVVKAAGQASKATLELAQTGQTFSGALKSPTGDATFADGVVDGSSFRASGKVAGPMPMTVELQFEQPADDALVGSMKVGMLGTAEFTASRA